MTGKAATGTSQSQRVEQDYARAVSSHEDPLSVSNGFDSADGEAGRELAWVDDMPERDRRLFAKEMSRLMAEAAKTDDLAPVERALREWRVTSEIYLDPELAKRLSGPRVANGPRVPRPTV